MRKTTRADFARFKKTFRTWQDRFGLNEWEMRFANEETPGNNAELVSNWCSMKATATLAQEHDEGECESIDESAFHEATELLLAPLYIMARDRSWDEQLWEAESHRVIHRLARAFGVLK